MRRILLYGLWIAIISLMFAIPANANSEKEYGNGGLGNGMGTRANSMNDGITANRYGTMKSSDSTTRTKAAPNYKISVYGTGTGSQFYNVNTNGVDRNSVNRTQSNTNTNTNTNGMDRNSVNRTQSNTNTNSGYRTMETTTSRGMGWGWIGLLGLIGLFGIMSRNPQRNR